MNYFTLFSLFTIPFAHGMNYMPSQNPLHAHCAWHKNRIVQELTHFSSIENIENKWQKYFTKKLQANITEKKCMYDGICSLKDYQEYYLRTLVDEYCYYLVCENIGVKDVSWSDIAAYATWEIPLPQEFFDTTYISKDLNDVCYIRALRHLKRPKSTCWHQKTLDSLMP